VKRLGLLCVLLLAGYAVPGLFASQTTSSVTFSAHGDFVDNLLRALLPISVRLDPSGAQPSEAISLVDAQYCGAGVSGEGVYLARGPIGATPLSRYSTRLTRVDCSMPLTNVAARLCASDGAQGVVRLSVKWVPWAIDVESTDAALALTPPACDANVRTATGAKVLHFAAGPISVNHGLLEDRYFLATRFFKDSATFRLVPQGAVDQFAKKPQIEEIALTTRTMPSNAFFSVPIELINRYSAQVLTRSPISLELSSAPAGFPKSLVLESPSLAADGVSGAILSGRIVTDQAGAYAAKVFFSGEDLVVSDVQLDYITESCDGKPILQQAECLGRNALRSKLGAGASQALSNQYRGTRIRPFGTTESLRMELEGKSIDFIGIPVRTARVDDAVSMEAFVAVER
jgi:hypothetical protein